MLRDTGLSVIDLFMIGAASGIMIGAINYSGAGFTLSLVLIHVAAGSLILLLIVSAVANIILGAGLPTVGCYILLATLVAPTLIQMGIEPMAAHMFILYYGCLSLISPPVAVAAFVAANLAGADPNRTGWVAMAFGWTIFVIPFLFVYSGTLLLKGDPIFIAIDFVTAVAGVWFISAAVMGYSLRPICGSRPRGLRRRRAFPAASGRRLRRRALVQHRRRLLAVALLLWERTRWRARRDAAPHGARTRRRVIRPRPRRLRRARPSSRRCASASRCAERAMPSDDRLTPFRGAAEPRKSARGARPAAREAVDRRLTRDEARRIAASRGLQRENSTAYLKGKRCFREDRP